MKKIVLASITSLLFTATASAQTPVESKPVRFVASFGLAVGGDTLATTHYTDGSSVNIPAGTGLVLAGGLEYSLSDTLSIQGTLGYHGRFTPEASNGSASFSRFPIELLAHYKTSDQWRLGGGVRFINNPKVEASGAASGLSMEFDNSVAGVIEAEYILNAKSGIKMRVANDTYKVKNSKTTYSGTHFAVAYNYYF